MTEEKTSASEAFERRRKMKVAAVAAVLGILCVLILWTIFSPTTAPAREGDAGINTSIPDGRAETTEGDKRKVTERVRSEEVQQRRMLTLGDNSFSLLDDGLKPAEEKPAEEDPIGRAEEANRAMQAQVQSFYAQPARDPEAEALREQVAALQSQLDAARRQPDPLQIAEEQYKLAQKYLGGGKPAGERESPATKRQTRFSVMRPVREGEVAASTLNPAADFTAERNLGFLTAAGAAAEAETPTVRACIAATQVIRAGGTVRLRLLEAVRIGDAVLPRNTPLYGTALIAGMRLQVTVSSIEYRGRIFSVEAEAYDLDGQRGLNVPDSKERTALKEALASVGQTAGMNVNIASSAGEQVVSELARDGIQAATGYLSGKLREVKVTLKANHRLLLISKEQ